MGRAARRVKNLANQKRVLRMRSQAKPFGCRPFVCKEPNNMSELIDTSIDGLVSYLMLKDKTVTGILNNARIIDWPTFQLMLGIATCYNDKPLHPNSSHDHLRGVSKITYLMDKNQKAMFKTMCWLCRGNHVVNKTPEDCFAELFNVKKDEIELSKEVYVLIREIRFSREKRKYSFDISPFWWYYKKRLRRSCL
jgi:hypothetical protein